MKTKWLDRRIACPGPYLALCLSEGEYHAALKHLGTRAIDDWIKTDHADATVHFCESKAGQQAAIVCVQVGQDRTPIEIAGILIHESVHIWQRYCEIIGESNPGKEQEAYGIQSISQELLTEYAARVAS
jgi:hypothetical protein